MKKKATAVLTAILVFSMSLPVWAAPSPSIVGTPGAQIVIDDSAVLETAPTTATLTAGVSSDRSAVLGGTTFRNTAGQTVDTGAVRLVVEPVSAAQLQQSAAELSAAMASPVMQIFNYTGKQTLNMTDSQGNLNVIKNVLISVRDQAGNLLSINGAVAPAFTVQEILGENELRAGETIQAFYRRADGSWIALPVVIQNGAIAISIPSFGDYANVVFVIVQGTSLTTIPGEAMTSPNT